MSREDLIQIDGEVVEVFAGGIFSVKLNTGSVISAKCCGKMYKFKIRVLLHDRVTVGISPYDVSHGLIMFRHKA
jgi:translation initiation factor IF-1